MARSDIDGGWAWVILFTSFCGMLFNGCMVFSTGVFMAAMLEEIDNDLTKISWITGIFVAATCVSGPLVGFITNRFGCRVSAIVGGLLSVVGLTASYFTTDAYLLIPTFSILTGVGLGFITGTSVVVSGYYFKKFRPIASGITMAGSACGMFIGPPILRLLIDVYTLKGALLISGGIIANICVLGMLMRPSPTEMENFKRLSSKFTNKLDEKAPSRVKKIQSNFKSLKVTIKTYLHMFRNVPFLSYLFSTFAWCAGETAAILHLPNYTEQQGTSKMAAATLMTAMGITSLLSRLLTGFVATDPNIGPEIILIGLYGMLGILTITFPLYSHSFETQILYTAAYGMYNGGINTLVNPLIAELLSLENLASGFGLLAFTAGIGTLVGAPIAGMIVDNGGTYTHSYIYAGSMLLLASFSAAPIALRKKDSPSDRSGDELEMTIAAPAELEPLKSRGDSLTSNDIMDNDNSNIETGCINDHRECI